MTSKALQHKVDEARRRAPDELPLAKLCAEVVFASLDGVDWLARAVQALKAYQGTNWSHVTAFQFMSGRRGEFAADCAEPGEQVRLQMACLIAKTVCEANGLSGAAGPDRIDFAKLRELAEAVRRRAS